MMSAKHKRQKQQNTTERIQAWGLSIFFALGMERYIIGYFYVAAVTGEYFKAGVLSAQVSSAVLDGDSNHCNSFVGVFGFKH